MSDEQKYRYEERLGMMCADRTPTRSQERQAREWAMEFEDDALPEAVQATMTRIETMACDRRREYAMKKAKSETRNPHNND
jgi:hypothetical protein